MREAQEHNVNRKKDRRALLAAVAVFIAVVVAGVFVFLRFYDSYIDNVLYRERLSQMQEVTSQLFSGLEDVVENQWNSVDVFCNFAELAKPQDDQTLLTFLKKQASLNNFDSFEKSLVAVDNLGRYMTQDGWQGVLGEMNLLLDEPDKVSFVSQSLTNGDTRMYFLKRLQEPVLLASGERVLYYGISQDMDQLDAYFKCSAYDNSNSMYVLNRQGKKLFRSGSTIGASSLIPGYSAFAALEEMEYLHGHSFEDAKSDMEKGGRGYANAVLNGEEYYLALYQMDHAEWTLLFLVPSAYVATNAVSMINMTVNMVMAFAVILVVVAGGVIFFVLKYQQKRAVDAERRNSERLSEALDKAERAEQAANDANRAKSNFLANMSHDIRTPMNAIVGITKLMEHEQDDPGKLKQYIHKVQSSSQHLLGLINDVLDMSKIESSEVTLNHESISLAEQVGQVESIIRPQIEEHGQTFVIRVHEIVHEYLIGDAVRMRQVFINLLSNAVKYTPYGGTVSLDLEEQPSSLADYAKICITVTDNGYGMTPEFVSHIFEPFTRAEDSTVNKVQGTGLGMAITKSIVDLMGGTITVESELNKGSCFRVTLPLRIDKDAVPKIDTHSVLLVAQEEMLVRNVTASFRDSGVQLRTAPTLSAAQTLLREQPADAVLLSGFLDRADLPDIVGQLRRDAGESALIICVDYVRQEQVADILMHSGINSLVPRPFFLSNYIRVVNETRSEAATPITEENTALRGLRFLCAEDNMLNAEILEALLDMNGASCTILPNGQELVQAFARVKPGEYNAILMDVQMPVMNGLEATREIRRGDNPLGRIIPIIAMTANAFSSDVQDCLDAGMDAHVSKPLDIGALERTVRALHNRMVAGGGDNCSLTEDS